MTKPPVNTAKVCLFEPTIAAICTPTVIVLLYLFVKDIEGGELNLEEIAISGFMTLLVSGMHTILLGLPTVMLLRKWNGIRWWSITLAGFFIGLIPVAVLMWPVDLKNRSGLTYWDGTKEVVAKENGIPTMVGWVDYTKTVFIMGVFGTVCGLVFWYVQRRTSINEKRG